ncbi:MAG: hypothetical protein CSA97_02360 [Bacteroidetes bacterium]|nr:MAG: hypothetical protein CSA97_02360 [Bacteroidota bacterium]
MKHGLVVRVGAYLRQGRGFVVRLLIVLLAGAVGLLYITRTHSEYREELILSYRQGLVQGVDRLAGTLDLMDLSPLSSDSVEREEMRRLFVTPMAESTGYPFILRPNGEILFHFFRSSTSLPAVLMEDMAESANRRGTVAVEMSGLGQGERMIYYAYYPELRCYIGVETDEALLMVGLERTYSYSVLVLLVAMVVLWLLLDYASRWVRLLFDTWRDRLASLSDGEVVERVDLHGHLPLVGIRREFNELVGGLNSVRGFASALQSGDLHAEFTPLGPHDTLGTALLKLRDSMVKNEEEARRRSEQEEIRSWQNAGLAEFSKLLREHSDDIDRLSEAVVRRLVNYLGAAQGGVFVVADGGDGQRHLRLSAAFAYNRKKFLSRDVLFGEGLIGTCAVERELMHLDQIPPGYCDISSGIGNVPPRELLVVPLKTDDDLFGVVEIATLEHFSEAMVEFAQTVGLSIAQTMQLALNAEQTNALIVSEREQRVMMHNKEEELRQTIEELQATQEQIELSVESDRALRRVVDDAVIYVEFSELAMVQRANSQFEIFARALGFDNAHQLRLLEDVRYMAEDDASGASEEKAFRPVWDRVLSGAVQQVVTVWRGEQDERRLMASFVYSVDGDLPVVYMMAQDITSLCGMCTASQAAEEG